MWADHLTGVADITAVSAEGGEPRVNLGELADGSGFGATVAMFCGDGFYGLPNEPDASGGCKAFFVREGNLKRVVGTRDGRYFNKAGALKPGDRAITSACDARLLLKNEDSALTLYTTNQEDDGNAQMFDLRGKTGVTILLNGGCVVQQKKDEWSVAINEGGAIIVDKDGIQLFGKKISINGSAVTIGLMPGGLPPQPGTNSALIGPTGMAGIGSSSVTIAI